MDVISKADLAAHTPSRHDELVMDSTFYEMAWIEAQPTGDQISPAPGRLGETNWTREIASLAPGWGAGLRCAVLFRRAWPFFDHARLRPLTSGQSDVDRLETLRSLLYFEFDGGAFRQRSVTFALDRRKMHENIVSIGLLDKTKALGFVKPLHSTLLSHDKKSPR